jgi:hypothetical protein
LFAFVAEVLQHWQEDKVHAALLALSNRWKKDGAFDTDSFFDEFADVIVFNGHAEFILSTKNVRVAVPPDHRLLRLEVLGRTAKWEQDPRSALSKGGWQVLGQAVEALRKDFQKMFKSDKVSAGRHSRE